MFNCFLCTENKFTSTNQYIWHLKVYHNLDSQSLYTCKQDNCFRDFLGLHKFRQHLNRTHANKSNSITQLNVEIDGPLENDSGSTAFDPNITNENSFEKNIINCTFKDIVTNNVSSFIAKLYSKPNVTDTLLQEIVEGVNELFSNEIITHLEKKVFSVLTNYDTSKKTEIEEMFNVLKNPFLEFKTKHLRIKYFENHNLFFKPTTVVVGYMKQKKKVEGVDRLLMVPVQGHLLSFKSNLKSFFELPDIYETALKFTNDSLSSTGILTSFLNGSTWKKIKCSFSDKIVFPIFLYYDDAEMGNPLGSHSGIHKMGCVYYTVPSLPPEYLSSLDNIFVGYLFHSQDRGTFKINNYDMYKALIKELIDLDTNGISITVNFKTYQIYFALGLVLGDNLGLNSILGFVESFSANHYCRICRSPKSDMQKMIYEFSETLRNEINYDTDINLADSSQTGLNEYCIFNNVPSFHVTRNSVSDFMHDITEGVARYDMAFIIKNLIDLKYITLEIMNSRIEFFNYGVTENKNSPPKISSTNIINGCIIMSSSEMLCLVRYFGLIIGELVPKKTEVWRLYILLRKIVDMCTARQIQPECSVQLQALVAEHNRLYLSISKGTLKPKYHFLVHYGQLLLKNGPLILTSSIRFEAKHKTVKAIANAVSNRINLGHTLSNKIQLQMISRFLSKSG